MIVLKYQIPMFIVGAFIISCTHSHDDHDHDHGHVHATTDEEHEMLLDKVYLTDAQLAAIDLTYGGFEQIKMSSFVRTNGVLDLPPDEFASVTAPAKGFVKSIRGEVLVGSEVKKGTVLATIEHPDFIHIQQQYLEVLAQREYQEHEVERQQILSEANAGATKNYQLAIAELKVLKAKSEGLRQQLEYLGIEPEKVESGEITPSIILTAPISGFIAALNIHRGQYVEPEGELYEIVSNDHIHLELDVYENEVPMVKEGQRISFTVPSLGNDIYEGEVELISKSFDKDNKTVRVHGHILGEHPRFIRGLYIDAKIWTDDHTTESLPATAIVTEGKREYVFVEIPSDREGLTAFQKIAVRTVQSDGEFVQVAPIDILPDSAKVVTTRAYFLLAEMTKESFEHDH